MLLAYPPPHTRAPFIVTARDSDSDSGAAAPREGTCAALHGKIKSEADYPWPGHDSAKVPLGDDALGLGAPLPLSAHGGLGMGSPTEEGSGSPLSPFALPVVQSPVGGSAGRGDALPHSGEAHDLLFPGAFKDEPMLDRPGSPLAWGLEDAHWGVL